MLHNMVVQKEDTQLSHSTFVCLGIYFSILQGYKYFEASFTIADSIHESTSFCRAPHYHWYHILNYFPALKDKAVPMFNKVLWHEDISCT